MKCFQNPVSGKIVSPFEKFYFFFLSLCTPPQNNTGERRRRANTQQEIFSSAFLEKKNSPHKSKQDGALEPHLLT